MQAIDEGDLSPETVSNIATALDLPEADVVDMNRRLTGPDHSLTAKLSEGDEGEWQNWLADDLDDQETRLAQREQLGRRTRRLSELTSSAHQPSR
jgi:RNA polymerase sigma-32 factor